MNKYFVFLVVIILGIFLCFTTNEDRTLRWRNSKGEWNVVPADWSPGLKKLLIAYPRTFLDATDNSIIWPDGTEMVYDDGYLFKSYYDMLKNADLEDMMKQEYISGSRIKFPLPKNYNPGVVRYEPFFFKMYGQTRDEVVSNLTKIVWLPENEDSNLKITTVNNVHKKLQEISDQLDTLTHLHKYLKTPGGTFNWRVILNTNNVSMHSFGIAIDINVSFSNYWRWDNPNVSAFEGLDIPYKNKIPLEIVKIFEKHGFVWGGKWYHYDTMHFEYRPELLVDI